MIDGTKELSVATFNSLVEHRKSDVGDLLSLIND